jgi:hypothetical protein
MYERRHLDRRRMKPKTLVPNPEVEIENGIAIIRIRLADTMEEPGRYLIFSRSFPNLALIEWLPICGFSELKNPTE